MESVWKLEGFFKSPGRDFKHCRDLQRGKDAGYSLAEWNSISGSLPNSGISGKGSDWSSWDQVPTSNQSVVVMWVESVTAPIGPF